MTKFVKDKFLKVELENEGKLGLGKGEIEFETRLIDFIKQAESSANNKHGLALANWTSLSLEEQRMILRGMSNVKSGRRILESAKIAKARADFIEAHPNLLETLLPNHELYHEGWPSYVCGQDAHGHWINYECVEEFQVSVLDKMSIEDCILQRCQYYEAQAEMKRRISAKMGKRVTKNVYILDLKGLGFYKHFTPKVKKILPPLLDKCGALYPDVLWCMYIINAPSVFKFIWRIVLPMVDPALRPKIKILGGPTHYLPIMQENGIHIDHIPTACGGNSEMINMKNVITDLVNKQNYYRRGDPPASEPEIRALAKEDYLAARIPSNLQNLNDLIVDESLRYHEEEILMEEASQQEVLSKIEEDFDDDIILQGFFEKAGALNKQYKRRYFILSPKKLYYFTDNPLKNPDALLKGEINLYLITKIERSVHLTDLRSKSKSQEVVDTTGYPGKKLISVITNKPMNEISLHTPHRVFVLRLEVDGEEHGVEESANASETPRILSNSSKRDKNIQVLDQVVGWTKEIAMAVINESCDLSSENDERLDELEKNHYLKPIKIVHLKKGILKKRGAINLLYKTRYFILTSNGLYYYAMQNNSTSSENLILKKKVRLDDIVKVEALRKDPTKLRIHTSENNRLFRIKAATNLERSEWKAAIEEAQGLHQKFKQDRSSIYESTRNPITQPDQEEDVDKGMLQQWLKTVVDFASGINILTERQDNENAPVENQSSLLSQVSHFFTTTRTVRK